jgi:preprotein translocase SecE subunit
VQMHKRDEGMWARMPLAILGGIVTVQAARTAQGWASGPASYLVAGVVFALCALITLYLAFFHRKVGDVLIDTESEMRKVVWPTRDEVSGSTIVVIGTVFLLGMTMFAFDSFFALAFQWIGLY